MFRAAQKKVILKLILSVWSACLGKEFRVPQSLTSVLLPRHVVADKKPSVTSIDLLDFLALSPCELQLIVARRNSALGKVALESQNLINDVLFLNTAEQCLDRLSPNDKALREKNPRGYFGKRAISPTP